MTQQLETPAAVRTPSSPPLRILFATDGSPQSWAAADLIRQLPLPSGSEVQVITVLEAPIPQPSVSLLEAEQDWAARVLAESAASVEREGVRVEQQVRRGSAAAEIIQAARDFDAGLLVIGARGHSALEEFLMGSVARNVAKHARRPVLVARAPRHGLRKVVLALDESEHAAAAARLLAEIPLPANATVVLAHVIRPSYLYPALGGDYVAELDRMAAEHQAWHQQQAEKLMTEAGERLRQAGLKVDCALREGDPAAELVRLVNEQDADLLVAGARGVSAIEGLLVGSVADRLMKSCPVSLLLVH